MSTLPLSPISNKERLPADQIQHLADLAGLGSKYAPAHDLDLRVTLGKRNGHVTLGFMLHSPNGTADLSYQSFPEVHLSSYARPEELRSSLLAALEQLGAGYDEDGNAMAPLQAQDKLAGLGRRLYRELLPPELRAAYLEWRDQVHTLQIISDEPWIPWEVLRPYDDSDPQHIVDDDHLCLRYQVTRWLPGHVTGAGRILVRRLACLEASAVPGQAPLPFAAHERRYLSELAAERQIGDDSPARADLRAALELLDRGGVGLYHIATHGRPEGSGKADAALIMADGALLRPHDVHGIRQTHIRRERPLIFLNACRAAQQGWSLTQLGGWAPTLVGRCGCGAFVAPLWAVDDALAYEFAHTFYDALAAGHTIGEAALAARLCLRQLAPDNPTCLAYSIYARPTARVLLAGN
ncbi:MAG: CHAT domain-containing protein [Anaerolineae bacterium]